MNEWMNCIPRQRTTILKLYDKHNTWKVLITSQQKGVLAKRKEILKEFPNSKIGSKCKKKLLVQDGNVILKTKLETILSALGSL